MVEAGIVPLMEVLSVVYWLSEKRSVNILGLVTFYREHKHQMTWFLSAILSSSKDTVNSHHFPPTFTGFSDFFSNCCLLSVSFDLSIYKRSWSIVKSIAHTLNLIVSCRTQFNLSFLLATMLYQADENLSHVGHISIDLWYRPKPSWWLLKFIYWLMLIKL